MKFAQNDCLDALIIDALIIVARDEQFLFSLEYAPKGGPLYDFFLSIFSLDETRQLFFVKLQTSLTVQSKSVGLGVNFVFPPSQVTNNN